MATITKVVDQGGTGDYLTLKALTDDQAGITDGDLNGDILKIVWKCTNGVADPGGADFGVFTTTAAGYVWLYCDPVYRPRHKWDTGNKARIEYTALADSAKAIDVGCDHFRADGVYIKISGEYDCYAVYVNGQASGADIRFERCLLRSTVTGSANFTRGIRSADADCTLRVGNCLFYDFDTVNSSSNAMYVSAGTAYVFNCTAVNCYFGFATGSNVIKAVNCGAQNCVDGFWGTFATGSDYNASDISGDAPGGNSRNGTSGEVTFKDAGGDDFHLAQADTNWRGKGTDLSSDSDFPITDDIDSKPRSAWDVGACEYLAGAGTGTLPAVTGSGNGTKGAAYFGAGAGVLPALTGSGTGARSGYGIGSGSGTLPMLLARGVGLYKGVEPVEELVGYETWPAELDPEFPYQEEIRHDTLVSDPTQGKTITRERQEYGLRGWTLRFTMATPRMAQILRSFARYHIGRSVPFYYQPVHMVARPYPAPTLGSTSEGGLSARTIYVAYTWGRGSLETEECVQADQLAVPANALLTVTVPAFPPGVRKAWVYAGPTADTLYKQVTPITLSGGTWREPVAGYSTGGGSPPSENTLTETVVVQFGSPAYSVRPTSAQERDITVQLYEVRKPVVTRYLGVGRGTLPAMTGSGTGAITAMNGVAAGTLPAMTGYGVGFKNTPPPAGKMGRGRGVLPFPIATAVGTIAPPADYYVDGVDGSDSNSGTTPGAPFATIGKAMNTMSAGQNVIIFSATYNEQVTVKVPNIWLKGVGLPKIVSADQYGIYSGGVSDDVTLEALDITAAFAAVYSSGDDRWTLRDLRLHDAEKYGAYLDRHNQTLVERCAVYRIGNNAEAMGVMIRNATGCIVQDCQIYLVKKNGIRIRKGTANIARRNALWAIWGALALNETAEALVEQNYTRYTNRGVSIKHYLSGTVYNRVYHNTFEDSNCGHVCMGMSGEAADYFKVMYNLLKSTGYGGYAFLYNPEQYQGPHRVVDYNMYWPVSGEIPKHYARTEDGSSTTFQETLAELRAATIYEDHGLDYDADLVDQYGASEFVTMTEPDFVPLAMTVDSASSNLGSAGNTIDFTAYPPWYGSGASNQWIIYDLGSIKEFEYALLQPHRHKMAYCPKNIKIEVSDDKGSWDTAVQTQINDAGSQNWFRFSSPASGRYVRLWLTDNWGDPNYIYVEGFTVGNLV